MQTDWSIPSNIPWRRWLVAIGGPPTLLIALLLVISFATGKIAHYSVFYEAKYVAHTYVGIPLTRPVYARRGDVIEGTYSASIKEGSVVVFLKRGLGYIRSIESKHVEKSGTGTVSFEVATPGWYTVTMSASPLGLDKTDPHSVACDRDFVDNPIRRIFLGSPTCPLYHVSYSASWTVKRGSARQASGF